MKYLKIDDDLSSTMEVKECCKEDEADVIYEELRGLAEQCYGGKEWTMLINEEGLLIRDCHYNALASYIYGRPIYGSAIIVGLEWGDDGRELIDISSKHVLQFLALEAAARPLLYSQVGGDLF